MREADHVTLPHVAIITHPAVIRHAQLVAILLGDDIDHTSDRIGPIKRGSRALYDLDPLNR